MTDTKSTVYRYFEDHPEARDEVLKAFHARHIVHFREHPDAHWFTNGSPESACRWCERSRDQVRYDDLPAHCLRRPVLLPGIEETVHSEEMTAFHLLSRAQSHVPKLVERHGLSGETLALLHHTHGYDPETVAGIVDVPPTMIADYNEAMEIERDRSRAAQVREIITAHA